MAHGQRDAHRSERGQAPRDRGPAGDGGLWARGGLWVLAQFPLTALALYAARLGPTLPAGMLVPVRWLGAGLLLGGSLLFLAGALRMGPSLTPFPRPAPDARLIQSGVFGLARHPIYGGGTIAMLGWALLNGRWPGLLAAAALALFFNTKAGVEEQWLMERFSEYAEYRRRVRKLIPYLILAVGGFMPRDSGRGYERARGGAPSCDCMWSVCWKN